MAATRKRAHFGTGRLTLDPSTSVFLNCPYDPEYAPLFDAVVWATIGCGFSPRCAVETGSVAQPRMDRIFTAICESKYSIHDLSRCQGEGDFNLARFNMPLELGIAMARRSLERRVAYRHDWMVMISAGHPFGRFISDLAGFDPLEYNGTEHGVILTVMKWLATRVDAGDTLSPAQVLKGLPAFQRKMRKLRNTWGPWPPWADVILAAYQIAEKLGR